MAEWKGFEIHPEYPDDGPLPPIQRSGGPPGRSVVQQMAEEAGLPLHPNRIRVNSHRALEAAEFARDNGKFAPFHRRLFDASFAEGLNIGDVDVLASLAEGVGLDPEGLRRSVQERRYAARLADVTSEAHSYGINGTPTFVIGPYGVVGAQPYAALKYTVDVALGRVEPPVRRT